MRRLMNIIITVFYLSLLPACNSSPTQTSKQISGSDITWKVIGFGGGGNTYCPTVSPHNPNIMMLSCDMTGSYVTRNGGQSWKNFNIMGPVKAFTYDPIDSNVVYAISRALFRSNNMGETWEMVFPAPSDIEKVVTQGDEATETIVTHDKKTKSISAFEIDPFNSNILYAVIAEDNKYFFCVSTNRGATWIKQRSVTQPIKNIFLPPGSSTNRTILLAGTNTVEVQKDHTSKTWKTPGNIIQYTGGYDNAKKKFILYAIGGRSQTKAERDRPGVYISENEGETWQNLQPNVLKLGRSTTQNPEWRTIATSSSQPATIYLSYSKLLTGVDTFSMGILKSTDYGKTWNFAWKDLLTKHGNFSDPNYSGGWIDERFDPMWGENPFCFGVAPNNPEICYTTDYGRVTVTTNGGKTWQQCYTVSDGKGGWHTTGLDVTTGYGLVVDPFDSAHLFLPTTDIGLMESVDGGKNWKSCTKNNGVPENWVNTTYSLNFDNEVKGKAWAAMSVVHDLPRTKMFREHGVNEFDGGIVLTLDGGKTWMPVSASIRSGAVTDLLIDTSSSKNNRTLYACVFGKGVYKSTDDGFTWIKKNAGLPEKDPFAWRIVKRYDDNILFLIVSRRNTDDSYGNAGDGAIYRSSDNAETWKRMELPPGVNGPVSLVVDPVDQRKIIFSSWGRVSDDRFSSDTSGGIYLSNDDGKSWSCVLHDQHVHDITIDTRNNAFYACGFNSAAYRSDDRGNNWTRIKGFDFKWGKRVDPDPRDPHKIYVSTFGGGVWYGPAAGDPNAHEHLFSPSFH
ncbi:MAG: hypothetical protein JNK79_02400 [Chitinophagaceae bacterium]|nr:hypothetical protein [Chitinophagaceae bacterium]